VNDWSIEETDEPLYADDRNFYKVEQWTKDELHIVRLHYAGNSLERAQALFKQLTERRPRIRLTIRQRPRAR
jgi:hypothetical protein